MTLHKCPLKLHGGSFPRPGPRSMGKVLESFFCATILLARWKWGTRRAATLTLGLHFQSSFNKSCGCRQYEQGYPIMKSKRTNGTGSNCILKRVPPPQHTHSVYFTSFLATVRLRSPVNSTYISPTAIPPQHNEDIVHDPETWATAYTFLLKEKLVLYTEKGD